MPIQRTLIIIKPDAVEMGNTEAILDRYREAGLVVVYEYRLKLNKAQAGEFYKEHEGKFFYVGLKLALASGVCLICILQGENALTVARELNGDTDPKKAVAGTIHKDFESAGGPFNSVHSSDSLEAYEKESFLVKRFWKEV